MVSSGETTVSCQLEVLAFAMRFLTEDVLDVPSRRKAADRRVGGELMTR